ncbi:MAG: sulfotransferase domain-containing protein, partial [Isosphaeraceae bacterium]
MFVFCGGMYRACSTWQYQVASLLLERHRAALRLGYLTGDEFAATEPGLDGRCWHVLKSHEEHPRFRALVDRGRGVVIYAHRDLRDVIFSLMHKRRMSFETILRQGMIHQVIANDRFWSTRPGVLVQRYDDLIAEPERGVHEIAAHLGLSLAEGEAEEVAARYSFQANQARTAELSERL